MNAPARPSGLAPRARRPVRFVLAGVVNTSVSYGVYVLLLMVGLGLPLAGLVSLMAGIAVGFVTQGGFVFGHMSLASALRFVLAWAAMYGVHLGIVSGLLQLGISPYLGALVALGVLTLLSYFVLRDLVFLPQTNIR